MAVLGNDAGIVGHGHRQVNPDDQLDVVPLAGGHRVHHQLQVFLHSGGADHRHSEPARRPSLGQLYVLSGGVGHRFVLAAPVAVGDDVVLGVSAVAVGGQGHVTTHFAVMDDRVGRLGPQLVAGGGLVGLEEVGEQVVLSPHDGGAGGLHLPQHLSGALGVHTAPPFGPGHVQHVDVPQPSDQLVVGNARASGHHSVGQRVVE